MNYHIPGLEGYFGGKGGSGVVQQIINIIPPHKTLIIPFLGHCALTRTIKKAKHQVLIEKDPKVFDLWTKYFDSIHGVRQVSLDGFYNCWLFKDTTIHLYNDCSVHGIGFGGFLVRQKFDPMVMYCDPLYLHETRKDPVGNSYTFEMTREDHIRFLERMIQLEIPVLISAYENDLYNTMLKGWNTISFNSQTRSGTARETVYYNYDPPKQLHDYSFFGKNYKQREHYKLKGERLISKFERMTAVERNFYINFLAENKVISQPEF